MVGFKKMWQDVNLILCENKLTDFNIIEQFKSGFVVIEDEEAIFITKDDFVDFWCKILYFNEITKEQIIKSKLKYVYNVVRNLPYIEETSIGLRLSQ